MNGITVTIVRSHEAYASGPYRGGGPVHGRVAGFAGFGRLDRNEWGMVVNRLWRVTLRADGDRYAHLIVSAPDVECAESEACRIELAPRRSVVKVEQYEGE